MARHFKDAKAHVLTQFYGYIIRSDSPAYLSADDLKPVVQDMSSAHIFLVMQSLEGEKLVEADEDVNGDVIFGLTEKGILNAEKIITDSGLTLDQFEETNFVEIPEDAPVLIDHADQDIEEAKKTLSQLHQQIIEGNDFGEMTDNERDAAASEVRELQEAMNGKRVRPATFMGRVSETLGWIIHKAGETTISELAKKALGLIFKYFEGFHF